MGFTYFGFGNEFSDEKVLRFIFYLRKHVARTRRTADALLPSCSKGSQLKFTDSSLQPIRRTLDMNGFPGLEIEPTCKLTLLNSILSRFTSCQICWRKSTVALCLICRLVGIWLFCALRPIPAWPSIPRRRGTLYRCLLVVETVQNFPLMQEIVPMAVQAQEKVMCRCRA